jgi:hypothetical protein
MKSTGKWLCVLGLGVVAGAMLQLPLSESSKLGGLSEQIRFRDGKHKKYYPDGALQGEWTYKGDRLHGEGTEYYANGKTKYKDFWVNGNLVWRQTFDTNGVLAKTFGENPTSPH